MSLVKIQDGAVVKQNINVNILGFSMGYLWPWVAGSGCWTGGSAC